MKVIEQVKMLLEKGHKPKELLELGFTKTAITAAKRQIKREAEAQKIAAPSTAQATEEAAVEVEATPMIDDLQQQLADKVAELETQLGMLAEQLESFEAQLESTLEERADDIIAKTSDKAISWLKEGLSSAFGERFTAIERRLSTMETEHRAMQTELHTLKSRLDSMERCLDTVERGTQLVVCTRQG